MADHTTSYEKDVATPGVLAGHRNARDKTLYGYHAATKASKYSNFAGFGSEGSEDEQEERRNSSFDQRTGSFQSNDSPTTISPKSDGDRRDISLFNTSIIATPTTNLEDSIELPPPRPQRTTSKRKVSSSPSPKESSKKSARQRPKSRFFRSAGPAGAAPARASSKGARHLLAARNSLEPTALPAEEASTPRAAAASTPTSLNESGFAFDVARNESGFTFDTLANQATPKATESTQNLQTPTRTRTTPKRSWSRSSRNRLQHLRHKLAQQRSGYQTPGKANTPAPPVFEFETPIGVTDTEEISPVNAVSASPATPGLWRANSDDDLHEQQRKSRKIPHRVRRSLSDAATFIPVTPKSKTKDKKKKKKKRGSIFKSLKTMMGISSKKKKPPVVEPPREEDEQAQADADYDRELNAVMAELEREQEEEDEEEEEGRKQSFRSTPVLEEVQEELDDEEEELFASRAEAIKGAEMIQARRTEQTGFGSLAIEVPSTEETEAVVVEPPKEESRDAEEGYAEEGIDAEKEADAEEHEDAYMGISPGHRRLKQFDMSKLIKKVEQVSKRKKSKRKAKQKKPNLKSKSTSDLKAEADLQQQEELKSKSAPTFEFKSASQRQEKPQVEPKPTTQPNQHAETKPEPEPEPESDSQSTQESKPQPESTPKPNKELKPNLASHKEEMSHRSPQLEVNIASEKFPDLRAVTPVSASKTTVNSKTEFISGIEHDSNPSTSSESEPEPEPESKPGPEIKPDSKPDPDLKSESKPDPEAKPESKPNPGHKAELNSNNVMSAVKGEHKPSAQREPDPTPQTELDIKTIPATSDASVLPGLASNVAETSQAVEEVSSLSPPNNLPEASQDVTPAPNTSQDNTAPSKVSSASLDADHTKAAHTHTDSTAEAPLSDVTSTTMEDLMKNSMAGLCDRLEQMFNKRMQSLETTILRRMNSMQADLQELNSKVENVQSDIRKLKSRVPRPKVPRLPPSTTPTVKRKSVKREPSKPTAVPPPSLSPVLLSSQPKLTEVSAPSLVEVESQRHSMVKKLASLAHTGQSIDRTTALLQLRKVKYEAFQICPVPAAQLSSALVKYQKRVQRLRQRLR